MNYFTSTRQETTEEFHAIQQEHLEMIQTLKVKLQDQMVDRQQEITSIWDRIQHIQSQSIQDNVTINTSIQELDYKMNCMKMEIERDMVKQHETLTKHLQKVQELETQLQQYIEQRNQMLRENENLTLIYKKLDTDYQTFIKEFKSQYDMLQKRYHQIHTIMISNMEETEKTNQTVRDLIDLHKRMEEEYKSMFMAYEKQQNEYKTSLQEKDTQLKTIESLLTENNTNTTTTKLPTRIDELAVPKHITPKKTS
jgi:DNA repair exonuclease SbcCD ATPase subunit